jgi:F0F1-type ATP synthase membrane subunit b/b'
MKRQWIDAPATRENAKLRCHEIRHVNEELQPLLAQDRGQLATQREQIARGLRAQSILTSRDYASCLYPAQPLRQLMEIPQLGK